jgi:hypothetical protein
MEREAGAPAEREERLARFLLGALPPEEHAGIEERLFLDDDLDEELRAATDDLIHGYLSGSLSDEDRRRFETHFLASPIHRERMEFVQDLLVAAARVSKRRRPPAPALAAFGARAWLAAAVVALAAGGAALVFSLWPRQRPGQRASDQPSPAPPPTASAVQGEPEPRREPGPSPAPARLAQVVRLPRENTRTVTVALEGRTRLLQLEVPVELGFHPTFKAILRRKDGSAVWSAEELVPSGRDQPLILRVPAEALADGGYLLAVEGEVVRQTSSTPRKKPLQYVIRIERLPPDRSPARR